MTSQHNSQLIDSKTLRQRLVSPQLAFEILGGDLRRLRRARQRARHDQVGTHLEPVKEFSDVAHFLLANLGQRTLVVRLFPVRPIGFPVSQKIKQHIPPYMIRHLGPLVCRSICQRRFPPRKACRLWPRSTSSGNLCSFFVLPPPSTT